MDDSVLQLEGLEALIVLHGQCSLERERRPPTILPQPVRLQTLGFQPVMAVLQDVQVERPSFLS